MSEPTHPAGDHATTPSEPTGDLVSTPSGTVVDEQTPVNSVVRHGPAWGTMTFGVILLALTAAALLRTVVRFEWPFGAPATAVGGGIVLILIGLVASRRHR